MKKKLLSVLALSMCFCMGVSSFVGCKGGDEGSSSAPNSEQQNSESQGGETQKPLTQDEIFAKILEASEATLVYNGAIAFKVEGKEEDITTSSRGTEKETSEMFAAASVDSATGKMFMKSVQKEAEGATSEMTMKYFKEGEKNYSFMQQKQSTGAENEEPMVFDMYSEVSEMGLKSAMGDLNVMESGYFDIGELGLTEGVDVDAMNAAYAKVITESKADIAAQADDEDSEWYQCSADGSFVLSCAEVEGAYVLTVKMAMTVAHPEGEKTALREAVLTAKDGKLASMAITQTETEVYYVVYEDELDKYGEMVSKDTEGAVEVSEAYNYGMSIALAYEFAEADYNAITTTLPTDPTQIMPATDSYMKEVQVYINGMDEGREYCAGETIEEAMNSMYVPEGMEIVWYMDEACTQEFDVTMSAEKFFAMEALYGVATPMEGYVLYTEEYVDLFGADVTDEYKLVFADMIGNSKHFGAENVNSGFTFYKDEGEVITVNGTEVTFEEGAYWADYPVEEGQTYEVVYTTTYMKADLNFFSMFSSGK